ncbi:hypothetical protein [Marivita sp. XM-24bin2]|jgi:hypothetical protein|uniref:hypothetical protein n=1 Tax=unclassified Marivita TaxID=2632480 RepID=UPI000D7A04FE|nr:hypothetical protein [Marivita sp. XM-24bin2]MCR9110619.1 hypothetical protein [Paracoccaceae bacterium]PWL37017.1 MAG: hypothetical protein DCO97_00370 [Marivita sp. XM-24bin2]
MLNAAILTVVIATGALLLHPRLANATVWRATVTPLASIIGSGFLVIGPILDFNFGLFAPLIMLALTAMAYAFGAAIRYNIQTIDAQPERTVWVERLEVLASLVLAFAYVISVAYYLNLFGAFGISLTALDAAADARLLTTFMFFVILIFGWTKGFSALERLEQISVGLKLTIIAGLLFGLVVHFVNTVRAEEMPMNPAQVSGWSALTLVFGLIVTVQGFETSRYLGETYDARTRVRSMKLAQVVSTAIYVIYIALLSYAFVPGTMDLDETAIIDMMEIVAPILPVLLVAAALSAQFSAAVADTSGSGGLISEISGHRIPSKLAYTFLVGIGVVLTWSLNIFEIISYASRAFAVYYALQASIAALSAYSARRWLSLVGFVSLATLGVAIAVFGQPVEV